MFFYNVWFPTERHIYLEYVPDDRAEILTHKRPVTERTRHGCV